MCSFSKHKSSYGQGSCILGRQTLISEPFRNLVKLHYFSKILKGLLINTFGEQFQLPDECLRTYHGKLIK